MSKTIIVIKDKNTTQETVYLDIREVNFGYKGRQADEIIVTDKRGSKHYYPRKDYEGYVYVQIPNCNVQRETRPEEAYADYAERLIKSESPCIMGPREMAFLEGNANKIDWWDEIHAQKELNKGIING